MLRGRNSLSRRAIATADGQCCAQGGYKKEGHGDICKIVGPKVKGKKEL